MKNVNWNKVAEEYYSTSITMSELAEKIGCHPTTIRRTMRKMGKGRKEHSLFTIDKAGLETIKTMVEDGKTAQDIADSMNCSIGVIWKRLKKLNIRIKNKYCVDMLAPKTESEMRMAKEMAKLYYGSNMSAKDVCLKFNFALNLTPESRYSVLTRLFKKYDIRKDKSLSLSAEKFNVNQDFFAEIDNEVKAYILGFIYTDGNVSKKPRNVMSIGLQHRDKGILERMKKEMDYEGDVKSYDYTKVDKSKNKQKKAVLSICRKKICDDLINLGIIPCKGMTVGIPNVILNSNDEIKRAFIRGCFDGDGCLRMSKDKRKREDWREFNFNICGNKLFCNQLLPMINELSGIECKLYPTGSIWVVQVGGNKQVLSMLEWLYQDSTIFLKRKYERYLILKKQCEEIQNKQTSKYKGVWKDKRSDKFVACIYIKGNKNKYLGWSFKTDKEAAKAIDNWLQNNRK